MRLRNVYGILITLMVTWIIGYADEKNANEIFIDELMQDYNINGVNVPGASVAVICKNKLSIHRSYGFADIEQRVQATSMTNYRLASLTKQFTAAAVLLLTEKKNGQLELDDLIRRKWLPTLPLATDAITIRHLLTHTSGLIDYEDVLISDDDVNHQLHDSDVLDILTLQNRTYFTPPGSRYRYSNSGYALLALIVERASGKRFADFLREQIFLPLAMNDTIAYEANISSIRYRAYGYSGNSSSWTRTDQSQTSAVLGDGGIYSSIHDLAKWDAALDGNRLLSLESLRLAFTPATSTDDPAVHLSNIIPLKQLTKLIIDLCSDRFVEIIELYILSSNTYTFKIERISLEYSNLISIENGEIFQLLSEANNIKDIIIMLDCTLEITKFFVNLCPRLQFYTIEISNNKL
ncbi:unnamed protein product [Rotaria sp. Silwood1]|nr:unnamed protein product [Rotaria sp. Silwood1]CAF3823474.1 unnamed protein product [Rotaria sp. Silwood1]CAF3846231.1 unnamed protein product [Rotaria sp. Silwood1]CAF3908071.1 unnamed protein product [Rotaria sp. Silwood1]CAF4544461.1 unnamed protein product [Rotaria sp. Silwood1]